MTIKLDGKPLSDFGIELLSPHVHPAAPPTRDITLEIPGRHGLYHFGSTLGPRNFSFECGIIRELDMTTLQQRLRQFVAFLLDAYGKPREIRLTFDYEPDKYYAVKFAGELVPERFFSIGSFVLSFVAYKPLALKLSPSDSIMMDTNTDFTSEVPFFETQDFTVTAPIILSLFNEGTVAYRPHLFLEGVGRNIIVNMNGQQFKINSMNGNMIEIIGESYVIKHNGVSTFSAITGDFLELLPGENSLSIYGNDLNLTVSVIVSPKYL
jgi:phage-related protein